MTTKKNVKTNAQLWHDLVLYGVGAGYLVRFGLETGVRSGSRMGWLLGVVGCGMGMMVFSIKPLWRSIIMVALGIGLYELVTRIWPVGT